ncbi:MAG: ABC transporter permease [Acidobacteriota bacterium]
MSYASYIARRYLQFQRNPRNKNFISIVTLIAVAGIMLGVGALIITLTILNGFEKEIKEKVIGFTTHIQVTGFQNQTLSNYAEARRKVLRSVPNVQGISPFAAKEGMVRLGSNIEGIMVKGLDPSSDVSSARKYVVAGTFDLTSADTSIASCVIGKKLASRLQAKLGDTLIVFGLRGSYNAMQPPRIMPFVVKGMYESGMAEYDDLYFFVSMKAAQDLFLFGDAASGFDVMLHDVTQADETAKEIMELLGYPYYARTLFQLYRNLFTWIELQKEPIPIVLGLIIIVAVVNIIGTLLMVVLEKKHQIGILLSMGASKPGIKKIFLYEGIAIGMVGTLLGNMFGYGVCWLQYHFQFFSLPSSIYFMTTVPILFRWQDSVIVSAIAVVLTVLASWIPAMLASRLDPIQSIRFQ